MIKPKELMGYLSGAVLIVAAIGCAGGGSNPGEVVSFEADGTVNSSEPEAPETYPASEEDRTITIGGVEALLPPIDEAVPAGTPLALLEIGTSPLGPMDSDDTEALTRGPIGLYLWKDGTAKKFYSGLVTRDGLSRNVALSKGTWHIEMNPCYVYKVADPANRMTMRKIRFNFVVDGQGRHSFPRVTGVWPRNGSRLTNANYANAFVNPVFAGKACRLTVTGPSVTLTKTLTYRVSGTEATAQFRDIQASTVFVVPSKGIPLVTYDSGF